MHRPIRWLSVLVLCLSAQVVSAQDKLIDLLPEGACAFGVPSLKSLKEKGDKFIKDAEIPMPPGQRPSDMIEQGFQELRVQGAVNEDAPAVFMIFGPQAPGLKQLKVGFNFEKLAVGVIPIKDWNKLEANYKLKKGQLKDGATVRVDRRNFGEYLHRRGKHIFIGDRKDVVEFAAKKARPLADRLTTSQKKTISEADMIVHLAFESWGEAAWFPVLSQLDTSLRRFTDPAEKALMKQFINAGRDVSYLLGAARIDDGLGVHFVAGTRKNSSKNTKQLLAMLGSGKGPSTLKGLPQGRVLAAQGVRGDGNATNMIAKILMNELLRNEMGINSVISPSERPVFVGVLRQIWDRLQGSKTAVYINPNSKKNGLFSFLAVLDTNNPQEFIKEMKTLAKIAEGKKLDLTKKTEDGGEVDIEKLIEDLGSRSYRVRTAANFKIRLLGEPALPYLEKARKPGNKLEIVLRSKQLTADIEKAIAERRKSALSGDPFQRIRPTFVMVSNVEKRVGRPVDVIRIQLDKKEETAIKQLQEFLGPDWNNMRLSVVGKQVVLMLGSNTELFEKTLTNLQKAKAGLADSKSLTELYRYSNKARKFELHLSLHNLLAIAEPGAVGMTDKTNPLSSAGLSFTKDQLQLDLWLPVSEVRIFMRKANGR